MNRKQRQRVQARRTYHQEATRERDRPRLVMKREEYPPVERAHIVPRMYQKAFAVSGQVAVHVAGRSECRLVTTKKAGTRDAYYRRMRPTGESIDDVEASLASVEDKAAPILQATVRGGPLTLEVKGALAQFFAVQLMRGPAFFESREKLVRHMIEDLDVGDIRPTALAEAGGDVSVVRRKVLDAYLDPTQRLMAMMQRAIKIAGIIGNMRWCVLQFNDPVVAYSDHPVVVWPTGLASSPPFEQQQFGPLSAFEVRVPLSPHRALLMNWLDLPDREGVLVDADAAAELNAFTIGQAESAGGTLRPLTRFVAPEYNDDFVKRSKRRAHAETWLEKNKKRNWVNDLELIDLGS
jgi:hypothetical protein